MTKVGTIENEFRVFDMEIIAGSASTEVELKVAYSLSKHLSKWMCSFSFSYCVVVAGAWVDVQVRFLKSILELPASHRTHPNRVRSFPGRCCAGPDGWQDISFCQRMSFHLIANWFMTRNWSVHYPRCKKGMHRLRKRSQSFLISVHPFFANMSCVLLSCRCA